MPLIWFLKGKNADNKVNSWSLELATYNITFEWISGAKNKAADCLSQLVEPTSPSPPVHMLSASHSAGPTFNTRNCTQTTSPNTTSTPHPDVSPRISQEMNPTPKPLTADKIEALLQIQRTDPFCKCISRWLLNSKAPQHEFDTFIHVKGLLYKHVTDSGKWFLTLVIPKSWKYTVLVEAHDKLGHQGNSYTYCLIKRQYYWKGMNKDIKSILQTGYFANEKRPRFNSTLCRWQKYQIDHLIK